MPSDDIQEKLRQARLAMEGPLQREKREAREGEKSKQLEAARYAMEGSARREKRVTAQKEAAEKEAWEKEIDEEIERKKVEEQESAEDEQKQKQAALDAKNKQIEERQARFVESQATVQQIKQEPTSHLSPIRTLKTDLARALKDGQYSASRIIAKEQQKRETQVAMPVRPASSRSWLVIILSLILIVSSGALFYFVYINRQASATGSAPVVASSLIFTESQSGVDVSSTTPIKTLSKMDDIFAVKRDNQSLTNIYLTKNISGQTGSTKVIVNFDDFIKATNLPFPAELMVFVDNYMFGTLNKTTGNKVFLILKINSFEHVSAGLLSHESDTFRTILTTFNHKTLDSAALQGDFADKIVKNKNTRVLQDKDSNTVLIYGFIDTGTLIITEDEDTFAKVYDDYNSAQPAA